MIECNEEHNVNISIIDEAHKKFIHIVDKAIVAKRHKNSEKIKDELKEMAIHALRNFPTEEVVMLEFEYPD